MRYGDNILVLLLRNPFDHYSTLFYRRVLCSMSNVSQVNLLQLPPDIVTYELLKLTLSSIVALSVIINTAQQYSPRLQ